MQDKGFSQKRKCSRYNEFEEDEEEPLTKRMKPDVFGEVFAGRLDLTPTPDSLLIKLRKQKFRREEQVAKEAATSSEQAESNDEPKSDD